MADRPTDPPPHPSTSWPFRLALIGGGVLSLALGVLGIVLPLVPATPFVLLAAGCFARAWPAAHRFVLGNAVLGPICRRGPEGRYLPPRARWVAIAFTALSFGASIALVPTAPMQVGLGILGVLIVVWLARLPTAPPTSDAD